MWRVSKGGATHGRERLRISGDAERARGEGERGSAVPSADLRPGALQALGDEESVPRHKDVVNAAHLR